MPGTWNNCHDVPMGDDAENYSAGLTKNLMTHRSPGAA
jgi:hypothetical protein